VRLLVDANIILEIILQRKNFEQARRLLATTEGHDFFISNYSLHSIGTFLFKLNKKQEFLELLDDFVRNNVEVLAIQETELKNLKTLSEKFHLDFDDAYQYSLAEKYDLVIVSFDKDFDKTLRGRKTPEEILK